MIIDEDTSFKKDSLTLSVTFTTSVLPLEFQKAGDQL